MTRTLQLLRALAASRAAVAPIAGGAASLKATRVASAVAPAAAVAAARGLHGSAARLGIGSHMSDNDPVVLEKEKQRSLSKEHLPGGGGVPDVEGWSEALASDSEAVVRPARASLTRSATDRRVRILRRGGWGDSWRNLSRCARARALRVRSDAWRARWQVKAERSTVMSVETMTEFTVKRVREQNHDSFIAEEREAAEKEPQGSTG